jgi:hypothetical protein
VRASSHWQRIRARVSSEYLGMQDEIVIPPDRLLDAVDAVLVGLAEMGPVHTGTMPSSLLGTADQPRAFCDLTKDEVVAAERFLLRCGLLTAPPVQPPRTLQ